MHFTSDQVRAHYDGLPYTSYAYAPSAPEHLAAVAHLFGLSTPPVETARVLELGCAAGGNLVPAAIRHPGLRATGIDLSGVQIGQGRERVARLGLDNVTLLAADILALDTDALGTFDYIVGHGLYSWVPPKVQDAILRLVSRNLAADGVAYLSYNTYPGWKAKEILRDAMLLHGRTRSDPREQVAYARGMTGFLRQVAQRDGVLSKILDENLPYMRGTGDEYIAHEYLEPYNLPCYFLDFLERAGVHGLTYLGEAQPSMMVPANYGAQVAEPLLRTFGDDQTTMEQYLDFALNRGFRQTLLVPAARRDDVRHRLDRSRFAAFHFAAHLPCIGGATRLDGSPQAYGPEGQVTVTTAVGPLKRALDALTAAWPGTLSWPALHAVAASPAGTGPALSPPQVEQALSELVELLVTRGQLRIRMAPVALAGQAGPMPTIDPGVRVQAGAARDDEAFVTNAWHESVELTPFERHLVPRMDGTRDRAALAGWVAAGLADGSLSIDDGGSGSGPARAVAAVEATIDRLARLMLVARDT